MDGQTDGQTDRQGQNIMPPDYRRGGIKIGTPKIILEYTTGLQCSNESKLSSWNGRQCRR